MAVLFLFIDGVGLGKVGRQNPFHLTSFESFELIAGGQPFTSKAHYIDKRGHLFKGIDATLGIEGLPQSGTGQTTLFTGRNAAEEVGRHFGPFPHSKIKPFLKEESIFHKAKEKGKSSIFMNAYPDIFFRRLEENNRWSCTTLMTKSAGIPLHREKDLKKGDAITAEITQEAWRKNLNIEVPAIDPKEAAERMLQAAQNYDLLLYEYYLTDKAGHSQNYDMAEDILSRFHLFLLYLIQNKREQDTLLLSSDHGNIEDLSTKTHTFNKVPLFVKGPDTNAFKDVDSIQGVTPAIIDIL